MRDNKGILYPAKAAMSFRTVRPALGAAVLFGASTPLAKSLTGAISPLLLAGLLYLGSGVGLAIGGGRWAPFAGATALADQDDSQHWAG